MHLKKLLPVFTLLSLSASAQDKIYKRSGDVIEAKVKEVNSRHITYKRSGNAEGPDYVIGKAEVIKIVYENGTEEHIRAPHFPHRPHGLKNDKPLKFGSNIISGAVLNVSDEGVGFGLAYEHMMDKKAHFSFYLPLTISMKGYGPNTDDAEPTAFLGFLSRSQRIYQFMPGVKYYPTGNLGKVRYAVGGQLTYETGAFEEREINMRPNSRGWVDLKMQKMGAVIHNSINIFPNAHAYVGADLGLGLTYINQYETQLSGGDMLEQGTSPLIHFNFRLGYRF